MQDNTILLVDDEKDILEFLSYNLKKNGYEVYCARNGSEAISTARKVKPRLIILDVMMPEMDGIEACREIRRSDELKSTLVAFLSARGEDYSQIAGFEAGGDDYIKKPIRINVFLRRVEALMNRMGRYEKKDKPMQRGDLVIDRKKYLIIKGGKEMTLPKKEFELLSLLAENPEKVFNRDDIFAQIWGENVVVGDRTIDVHIRRIRAKIGMNSIRTIKGIGYFFSIQ